MNASKIKKTLVLIIPLFLVLTLLSTGCSKMVHQQLTMDNLVGKRIGVMNGYSSDYIFCMDEYKNYKLQLYRYDYYSDMVLALRFNRLDAAAMENDEAYVFCRLDSHFVIGLEPATHLEFGYPFNSEDPQFLNDFNNWIKEFRKTEDYADIERRVKASLYAPYQAKKVENQITTDRVLRVAGFNGWEPVSYINTETHEWEGSDVELITRFANSLGSKVEIIDMSYQQMLMELSNGSVALMLCPETLLYEEDMTMTRNITMSDGVFEKQIVLIVNKEGS